MQPVIEGAEVPADVCIALGEGERGSAEVPADVCIAPRKGELRPAGICFERCQLTPNVPHTRTCRRDLNGVYLLPYSDIMALYAYID